MTASAAGAPMQMIACTTGPSIQMARAPPNVIAWIRTGHAARAHGPIRAAVRMPASGPAGPVRTVVHGSIITVLSAHAGLPVTTSIRPSPGATAAWARVIGAWAARLRERLAAETTLQNTKIPSPRGLTHRLLSVTGRWPAATLRLNAWKLACATTILRPWGAFPTEATAMRERGRGQMQGPPSAVPS